MPRRLLVLTCLALAACGSTRPPAPASPQPSAETWPQPPAGWSTNVPGDGMLPHGLRIPMPRRGWTPSDERPPWLPRLPEDLPRFQVPDEWYRDNLALLQPTVDR